MGCLGEIGGLGRDELKCVSPDDPRVRAGSLGKQRNVLESVKRGLNEALQVKPFTRCLADSKQSLCR